MTITLFSQNYLEEYLSTYSGKGNLGISASLNFEIDEPMNFEANVKFINNRYFIIEILKPEIFIGINYTYDIYKGIFYTKQNNELDVYSEVSVITASIPSIFNTLFISFQPNKLNKLVEENDSFLIETYMPKSMNMLRLLGVDFIKFRVYFSKPVKGISTFSKFEILNSNETKKIVMKINNIRFIDEEESYEIIKSFLNN
ncbi:MAG: hypothetical protein PWQ85_58 [Geotoga sp.]|jgi:hypothetical protein|nr:hypothetical protein [Geotoga sp.]